MNYRIFNNSLGPIKYQEWIQSADDATVRKASADFIFGEISSKNKRRIFYNNGGHVIFLSDQAVTEVRERGSLNYWSYAQRIFK